MAFVFSGFAVCKRKSTASVSPRLWARLAVRLPKTRSGRSIPLRAHGAEAGESATVETSVTENVIETGAGAPKLRWALLLLAFHTILGVGYCMSYLGWTLADSLYFCVVTITTVGYGDLAPPTAAAKVFFMIYILMSLTIIGSALNQVVGSLLDRHEEAFRTAMQREDEDDSDSSNLLSGLVKGYTRQEVQNVVTAGGVFVVFFLIGVLFFMSFESMSVIDALYFIWVTCTTVGFGDLTPSGRFSRVFSAAFLLFVTIALANFIRSVVEAQIGRRYRSFRSSVLSERIDAEGLEIIDADDDNRISKDEYLIAMLRKLEAVPEDDLSEILRRFDELDVNGDGFVDRHELLG